MLDWFVFQLAVEGLSKAGFGERIFHNNPNVRTLVAWWGIFCKEITAGECYNMSYILQHTQYQLATNPCDKIYSLLGLISTIPEMEQWVRNECVVDYKDSVEAVFTRYAWLMLCNDRNLRTLTHVYRGSQHRSGPPSWVPDWRTAMTSKPLCTFALPAYCGTRHSKRFKADLCGPVSSRLALEGCFIDKIKTVYDAESHFSQIETSNTDGDGSIAQLRDLHTRLTIPTLYKPSNEHSLLALMNTLTAGNLPCTNELSWDDQRSEFPSHFERESELLSTPQQKQCSGKQARN